MGRRWWASGYLLVLTVGRGREGRYDLGHRGGSVEMVERSVGGFRRAAGRGF